jgi:WD40 repeat protein/transcriptional regulator with XRE-family HTH domain
MSNATPFGQIVREHRRALDLTQEELARRVGCAGVTLRKIETGRLRASRQIAERIAVALGIPLEERAAFVRAAREVVVEPALTREPTPSRTPTLSPEEVGSEDLSGRAIRSYQLGERIGVGGFGAVYRAVQPGIEREVAVKLILPRYADHPDFIRRFETEARVIARLEHPHIVPLYDYWRDPGFAFLVMRFLRGGSLADRLSTNSLSPAQVLALAEQVGEALAVAHRAGIIHRDLKPSNILLDEDGNAFLADFGIAKDLGELGGGHTGAVYVGSPAYSSPEQIRAEPVTPQSDIYAFGVLIYELLSGQRPFRGPNPAALIQQQLSSSLPRLSEVRPDLPAALDLVLQRATAKLPSARHPDLRVFLAELRAALGASPASALAAPDASPRAAAPTVLLDLDDADNPYRGLQAFDEADVDQFFGRETLLHRLLSRMDDGNELARFLALIGPSGSGKSSLVRAGLLPALRRGGLPGSDSWYLLTLTPGAHPLDELARQLRSVAPRSVEAEDLRALLGADDHGLLRGARLVLPPEDSAELLLLIDQFEEVFTLCEDKEERAQLLRSLVTAVLDERSRVRVVLTLRGDFVDQALLDVDFGELLRQRGELVLPLTADELERAIVGPAQRLGLSLEGGLLATMIDEVSAQPGALPLLQHTLSELFRRRSSRVLTQAAYVELGGVSGALAASAETIYSRLTPQRQAAARQLFLRLVTPGMGVADTRRRAGRGELDALIGEGALAELTAAFGQARLLTFDHDPASRAPTVEVAHEALLRGWPRLREWIDSSREALLTERRLALAAGEWAQSGYDPSYLVAGARLEQFVALAASEEVAMTSGERAYLEASRAAAEAEEQAREAQRARELAAAQELAVERATAAARLRVRARFLAGVGALALLAALAAGVFGVQARQSAARADLQAEAARAESQRADAQAEKSQVQALALRALNTIDTGDPETALLYAIEAYRRERSPLTDDAMRQALDASRLRQAIATQDSIISIDLSPDGQRLAIGTINSVFIWDRTRATMVQTITTGLSIDLRWSPDGRFLATTQAGATLGIYETVTWTRVQELQGHTDLVQSLDWSPDSSHLVTSSTDETVRIWDVAGEAEPIILEGASGRLLEVKWSPDGSTIVSGSTNGTIYRWRVRSGEPLAPLIGHNGWIESLAWSPNGSELASGGSETVIHIWNVAESRIDHTFDHQDGRVGSLEWRADGSALLSGHGRLINVWVPGQPEPLLSLQSPSRDMVDTIWGFGTTIISAHFDRKEVRIWEGGSSGLQEVLRGNSAAVITSSSFSPDGTRVAASSTDGTIQFWNVATGKLERLLEGDDESIAHFSLHPDGMSLASVGVNGTVRVWDLEGGAPPLAIGQHDLAGTTAVWSPDGRSLASTGIMFNAFVWQVGRWDEPRTLQVANMAVRCLRWSPDGNRVAIAYEAYAPAVLEAASSEVLLELTESAGATCVDWSPDGTQLVIAEPAGIVRIVDAATGAEVRTFQHGSGEVLTSVAWSPDGGRIASAGVDSTIRIFAATSGDELLVLRGHRSSINSLAWSGDGVRLVSGGDDGTVRVWQLDVDLMALAESRLTRRLSPEQRVELGLAPPEILPLLLITTEAALTEEMAPLEASVRRALDLDPGLDLAPQTAAVDRDGVAYVSSRIFAPPVLAALLEAGRIGEAIALMDRGMRAAPLLVDTSENWRALCWYGSAWSSAEEGSWAFQERVLQACERSVQLAPNDANTIYARGIARALADDRAGSLEDLRAALESYQRDGVPESFWGPMAAWIATLQASGDPFDAATLESLRE